MTSPLPPLRFTPILKPRAWGGDRLATVGRHVATGDRIGESWDLADLPDSIPDGRSRVAEGPHAGRTLSSLMQEDAGAVLGSRPSAPTGGFPLLVKLIDARDNLSVQVHPDPAYTRRHPGTFVKNEAWYVLEAPPGAAVYRGVDPDVEPEAFFDAARQGDLLPLLTRIEVEAGDCVRLPSGICHALGAGVLVAEVQTPSDTTLRVWDWDRHDPDRPLHLAEAGECMRFGERQDDGRPACIRTSDAAVVEREGIETRRVCTTDDFTVDHLRIPASGVLPIAMDGEPRVLFGLEGDASVVDSAGCRCRLHRGDTVLLPASCSSPRVEAATESAILWVDLPTVTASARA